MLHRLVEEQAARVGLCVERRPGMVPALLGILKAGSTYQVR